MGGIAAGMGGLSGAGGFAGAGGLAGAGGSGPLSGYDLQMNYLVGVTGATDIAFHTDGRAVVTEKSGTIVVRRVNGSRVTQNGAFAGIDTSTEKGLLGVVADPNVATNHRFYFYATYDSSAGDIGRVMRGTLGANDAFTIDSVPIVDGLSADQVQIGGGMWIAGTQLFVGVGDGGYNTSPPGNKRAQCLNLPNGKILRVNLDGSTPNDNPLVAVPMVTSCTTYDGAWSTAAPDTRIYAWGLRNPWRFWIDPGTNLLWIGDVGNVSREEISIGGNGTNFGWPFREATTTWPALDGKDCSTGLVPSVGCTAPVYDYARGVGPSVTGGLIPSGCGWENVWPTKTYYVFGDWSADFIKALEVRPDRTGLVNSTPILLEQLDNTGPASFRMGADDSLYVVMNRANAVYRFTPKTRSGAGCP
jgi:glucose/arabinose dehydrogenase